MATALLDFDREHLWHPYSSMTSPAPVHRVASARGVRLGWTAGVGTVEVVDAMSSWWCAIHGYAVPELDAAVRAQLDRMSHVMFGGLTHEPAVELGRRLVDALAPGPGQGVPRRLGLGLGRGRDEDGLAGARGRWHGQTLGRTRFFTIRGGYHGDTFSPMSVTDPEGGMHAMYAGFLPRHVFARPACRRSARTWTDWTEATTRLYEQHADEIAAVIVEPVLQGAGGMHVYHPGAVRHLASLARAHGALVIFDEIATGLLAHGHGLGRRAARA